MPRKAPTSPDDVLSRVREMLGLGDLPAGEPTLEMLRRRTRRQLLACARQVGLAGIYRLSKDAVALRLEEALRGLRTSLRAITAAQTPTAAAPEAGDLPHRFDLGPMQPAPAPRDIPWGYGQDRVTAMVVDPERLYVYWEVTDDAITRARAGLGAGGADAWLNLRVYDITDRIFDGTNAHGYFDHKVERGDRQWFFDIGKAGSAACVELGLKSLEGYFVRIVRSGRAEFPRRGPVPPGGAEWLTVHTASGAVGEAVVGGGTAGADLAAGAPPAGPAPAPERRSWDIRLTHGEAETHTHGEWEWHEIVRGEWGGEVQRVEWRGPLVRTAWEAGPFTFPVESPLYVEERYGGDVTLHATNGRMHVVYGPWQVVIRGLGAHAERRVLATWEMHYAWTTSGVEVVPGAAYVVGPGGSELVALGGSERSWAAASEVRLGGASEVYRVGASELRLRGASEVFWGAASELRLRGASEWRALGASEWRALGASEWRAPGASEWGAPGASEALGGSEGRLLPPLGE